MGGIKIPQQDFALKMQGEGGGRICGTVRYIVLFPVSSSELLCLSFELQINSAPISLESNGEKGASEKEAPGELSNGAVARFPLSQSKVHSTEKKQPDEDYVDGPTLCKLEQNTAAAMKKGMTLSTGDEGYAAWLQYREIQRAKKKAGLSSVGPSMIGIGLSGEPLPFKVKGGQRILCLDGGGIKGLVQIEILRQIQEATGKKITDLFEWIVGTSTGGILALAMVYGEFVNTIIFCWSCCMLSI